ncbi:hypothetical protein E2320_011807 [Naja naja]|nr:hypothetical protein E2320_011807 [Naja naja]
MRSFATLPAVPMSGVWRWDRASPPAGRGRWAWLPSHFHQRLRSRRVGEPVAQNLLRGPWFLRSALGAELGKDGSAEALCTCSEAPSPAAMGIVKLAKLIKEEAPDAVRPVTLQEYRDRVVAVDVSVAIYQFRTAMPQMVNRHGQDIKDSSSGRCTCWKRPEASLCLRRESPRAEAAGESHVARRRRKQDSETLLTLLGVPYIQAPAEAEATCAALVKSGHACHLEEISLPTVLQKLGMRQEQFVDLCILLGCDYCDKVRGWGLKKALRLLQLHGSIEEVLRNTSRKETRQLFLQPEVVDPGQVVLEWKELDEEGLVNFLVHQKCINEARESIVKGRPRKAAKTMKDFFPVQKRPNKEEETTK